MLSDDLKDILPDKLWTAAGKVISHYKKLGYRVSEMVNVDEKYRYRFHIVCKKGFDTLAIEVREKCNVESYLENQLNGMYLNKTGVRVYYAVPEIIDEAETQISHAQSAELKRLGIGLIVIRENEISTENGTVGCHRRFAIEIGSSLGKYKQNVEEVVKDYNEDKCLDAVKDLTEIVEEATISLALKAIRKGKINLIKDQIDNNEVDWAGIINCLGAKVYAGIPQTQIIDKRLRLDLDDYRDTRNLSAHWKTKKKLKELEEQYPEAMQTGIRLLRKLVSLYSKLK